MMLPSGQPLWQKGMPQSMHRAPCARNLSSGILRSYSRQSCKRSATGRRAGVSRLISMNPVIFPIFLLFHQHVSPPLVPCGQVIALSRFLKRFRLHRGQTRHVVTRAEMLALEHRTILGRHHSDELTGIAVPVGQDAFRELAPGVLMMAHDQGVDSLAFLVAS